MPEKMKDFTINDMDLRNPTDLKPSKENPRVNEQAVERLMKLVSIFGFQDPIDIDEKNNIICGHTRTKVALALGLKLVPVHVKKGWTEIQKKEYRIAHNKSGEFSFWDKDLLRTGLIEIDKKGNPDATGFNIFERKKLIDIPDIPSGGKDVKFTTKPKQIKCPQCGFEWESK